MAIGETAKLVASLELNTTKFTKGINDATGKLGKLSKSVARSRAVAVGVGVGLERIAETGVRALSGAIAEGIQGALTLEKAQAQTQAAIKSTGGAAGVTAQQVRDLAEAQENLTTADDKSIQQGENLLLTFTKIGKDTFPQATAAMVNMAIAFNKGDAATADFDKAAVQLGKALNDPAAGFTALKRSGVSFSEEQIKILKNTNALTKEQVEHYLVLRKTDKKAAERFKAQVKANNLLESQKLIIAELNKEFGEAGKAAGTGFAGDINRANDAIEDAQIAIAQGLIPAVGEVARELSTTLRDPAVVSGLKELGRGLGDVIKGGVAFAKTVPWETIATSLRTAAGFAKDLLGAFLGLPAWVQTAVITGWGLNKISGGLITDLASGLIKGVLGINAGVVNLKAATVVGGPGGVPGGGGIPAGGGAAAIGLIPLVGIASIAAGAAQTITEAANADLKNLGLEGKFQTPGSGILPFGIESSLNNIATAINLLGQKQKEPVDKLTQTSVTQAEKTKAAVNLAGDKQKAAVAAAAAKATADIISQKAAIVSAEQSAAAQIVGAIKSLDLDVTVSSTNVERTTVVNNRYGPPSSSRDGERER